jgi:hypothetical protein
MYAALRVLICSEVIICAPPALVIVPLIAVLEAEPLRMISQKILEVSLYPLNIHGTLRERITDPIK